MKIGVGGKGLTIEILKRVARDGVEVELAEEARERISACRRSFESELASGRAIYGVNTGIGEFSERRLDANETARFQESLVRSHAAGIGGPAPEDVVRGAMLARVNVHAKGRSGCRLEVTETLVKMLNARVTPVVCLRGSVGACGDLAPMSQIALLLIGEGEATFRGERLPGREAMARAGIELPGLQVRDGLAVINGANVIAAASALQIYDIDRWLRQAEIAAAMSFEGLCASVTPFLPPLHEVRGFVGSMRSARSLLRLLEGGAVQRGQTGTRVQDAYSIRSSPQIIGAAHDALSYARSQVEIELNGVGDNPVMFPERGESLTGANFQGTPVALPMDMITAAVTTVSVLSERRLNRLLNPSLNNGLPAFLSSHPGPHSGLMLSQYTAAALVAEQRCASGPASIGSIPTAADQEDFVSMGMNTVLNNMRVLENAWGVLGIEMMAAAQSMDLRGHAYGAGTSVARSVTRDHVPTLVEDRQLSRDHDAMRDLLVRGDVLQAVEQAIGPLS